MKKLLAEKKNVLINAGMFQTLWFAAVLGSTYKIMWPCIIMLLILSFWQLQPERRANTDLSLMLVAVTLGLIIDSLWVFLGILEFTDQRPFGDIAPLWIIVMWAGFALTVNHSMAWMGSHPLLPSLLGLISAPLAYFGGMRLGAVVYHQDALMVSACIGLAWAIALPILVYSSRSAALSFESKKA